MNALDYAFNAGHAKATTIGYMSQARIAKSRRNSTMMLHYVRRARAAHHTYLHYTKRCRDMIAPPRPTNITHSLGMYFDVRV
jgi:hypothetical protein